MSASADYFLKKTLGDDFLESLSKVELWKPGTKSTIDHEELRTALQIVPRTILGLLIRELSPLKVGDNHKIQLPVPGGAVLNVTKQERDVYSGDINQGSKVIVDFKLRALPGVGLIIMSAFELYDMDSLINQNHVAEPDVTEKVQKLIDDRLALHDLIGKVVDKKIMEKDAVNQLVMGRLTDMIVENNKNKEEVEHLRVQMAGVSAAAYGYGSGKHEIAPGSYGHSVPYEDVKKLYEKKEELREEVEKIKENISQVTEIAKSPGNADANEYMRGMANGLEVANSTVHKKEPKFVEPPKKKRPLEEFLEKKHKKQEYSVVMTKGERVDCPDCGKNIFDGKGFSGCICLGDDMERKVFIKKEQDGIKVRFSKGWDEENIEMLLEVLRNKKNV